MNQLECQARLADARLADDGQDLTAPLASLFERAAELLELRVATHEERKAASGSQLEPRPYGADTREFMDLDRVGHALDRDRPAGCDLNVAFGELQGRRGKQDGAWRGKLLHARGQVSCQTD